MQAIFLHSIFDIDSDIWDNLWSCDYPFIQHAFLAALESSGSTCENTGWKPCHLLIKNNGHIIAAMPLYEKNHSYGEYVFDWAWADAYHRAGLTYYPKLINAIPFTPATGPRIYIAKKLNSAEKNSCMEFINTSLKDYLHKIKGSSFHSLFPDRSSQALLQPQDLPERQACQFHWFNQNYKNFNDFLSTFNSRKRKSLKRERRKVLDENIVHQMRHAQDISEADWKTFYELYQITYFKRSGRQGYLNIDFFMRIAKAMPQKILLASAHLNTTGNEMLAAALYFRDDTTLYGRYWGTKIEIDGLHFETCYYQGIEYAIDNNLQRFDPGAQGEHKIQRGFTPVKTCSYHSLLHTEFQTAVADFVLEEKKHNDEYCDGARTYLPFKDGVEIVSSDVLLNNPQEKPHTNPQ